MGKMYHGSPKKLESIDPQDRYAYSDEEPVVFATPDRTHAISYIAPWSDDDFVHKTVSGDPALHMEEQYPGAFEKLYKGRKGYLYELDPSSFSKHRGEEFTSKESPEILSSEEIDLYEAMLAEEAAGRLKLKRAIQKTASEQDFSPDFTPEQLKELGVYDQVYGDMPSEASMKEWPEHWINKQDPLGWLQWYDRYSEGRRTDDDSRQIKRWKSFKARHLAQYLKNPTPRRAAALRNWGIDVSNQEKLAELIKESKGRLAKNINAFVDGLIRQGTPIKDINVAKHLKLNPQVAAEQKILREAELIARRRLMQTHNVAAKEVEHLAGTGGGSERIRNLRDFQGARNEAETSIDRLLEFQKPGRGVNHLIKQRAQEIEAAEQHMLGRLKWLKRDLADKRNEGMTLREIRNMYFAKGKGHLFKPREGEGVIRGGKLVRPGQSAPAPAPVATSPVATVSTPPVATPPVATPPVATPPVATPPVATPPVASVPVSESSNKLRNALIGTSVVGVPAAAYAFPYEEPTALEKALATIENMSKTAAKGTATKRDPKKWSAAKSRAKAKMGGKWSARAAQLAVKYYKDSGGTYSGKKPTKKNNKLKKWTKEEWGYRPGSKAQKDSKKSPSSGTKGRYLPKKKWQSLSKSEQKATDAKKKKGMKKGKGIVSNTAKAKYDSKKDYTKKSSLEWAIIKYAAMDKEAKSSFVKYLERLVRQGNKEKALELLRKAEQNEGIGTYSARQIKGLTDDVLGRGQHGEVGLSFYGGKLVPTKRLRLDNQKATQQRIQSLEAEGQASLNIENIVKNDPELSRLVQTPEFLAKNTGGLVGQGRTAVQAELQQLKSINPKYLTRQQKGRIAQLEKDLKKGEQLGAGQAIPMSRVDTSANVSYNEAKLQRLRAAKAKQILEERHNIALTDLNPGARNENMFLSTTGKPTLVDFGIVNQPGWRNSFTKEQLAQIDRMISGTHQVMSQAQKRTVSSLIPSGELVKGDSRLRNALIAGGAIAVPTAAYMSSRNRKPQGPSNYQMAGGLALAGTAGYGLYNMYNQNNAVPRYNNKKVANLAKSIKDLQYSEKDSKKSSSSGTKGRYLPKKKWQSLSKSEQKATDAKKREGMNKGKGVVSNTAKAKYDSNKDYTKSAAATETLSPLQLALASGVGLGTLYSIKKFNDVHQELENEYDILGKALAGTAIGVGALGIGKYGLPRLLQAIKKAPKSSKGTKDYFKNNKEYFNTSGGPGSSGNARSSNFNWSNFSTPDPSPFPETVLKKYRKIRELSRRGVGGEQTNATNALESMNIKYPGIDKYAAIKLAMAINALKYTSAVSPNFKGYISQKRARLTTPIEDLPKPPPPANASRETRNELIIVKKHMEEGKLPESLMILADRAPEKIFEIACEKFGIDPKKKQASIIKEDFNKIAFDLKYIFKRPRPWSLAEHHGVNLNVTIPESADTPSYPSGHAMMGYGLAEFYKSHYPEYSQQWDKIADIIQHSRLQAGLHFPSDIKYAKDIVMEISKREKVASSYMTKQAKGWNLVSKVRTGAGRLRDAVTRRKAPANPNPVTAETQVVKSTQPAAAETQVVQQTNPQVVQQTNPQVVQQTTQQTTQAASPTYAQQWQEFYANARANPYSLLMSPTLRGTAFGAGGAYFQADQDRGQAALMGALLGAGVGRVAPGVLRHAGSKLRESLQATGKEQAASSGGFFSRFNPANIAKRRAQDGVEKGKSFVQKQLEPDSFVSRYGIPVGTGIAGLGVGTVVGQAYERDSSPVTQTTNNIISVDPEALKKMLGLDKLSSAIEKRGSADYRPRGTLFLTDGKGNVMAGAAGDTLGSEATSPYYFPGGGVFEEEGVDRVPTKEELEEGIRREALEELGYSIKNYKQLKDTPTNLDMPEWWKERQRRKRDANYKGLAEYYGAAEVDKKDMSLYNIEGDAFGGDWTPIEDVASALESVNPDTPYGKANLEQARLLRSLQKKTAKDDHVELRRKERANHISKKRISKIREAIKETQQSLPKGTHHVKLDNASAVIKDVGDKHVLATLLAANMYPPGDDLSSAILKTRRK